jgi:hypothetical protein
MVKLVIGLLCLLVICVIVAAFRRMRGRQFLPANNGEPQSLRELAEQRRAERAQKRKNSN